MELLTIIIRSLQFFSVSILLLVIILSAIIKIKSRKKEKVLGTFSNPEECVFKMADRISSKIHHELEMGTRNTIKSSLKINERNRMQQNRINIYAVYKPESNRNFYFHNNMNWYKNFD